MKFHKNQSGFSAVVTTLIVVVMLIGAVGWLVYDRQKTETPAKSNDTVIGNYQKEDSNSPYYDDGPKLLELKEWGVKIPVAGDIADAYYVYKQANDTVYLSKESYKGTGCAADATTLGAIGRFAIAAKDNEENAPLAAGAIELNGYYYYYAHPQAACSDDDTVNQQASSYMSQFKAAVDKISS